MQKYHLIFCFLFFITTKVSFSQCNISVAGNLYFVTTTVDLGSGSLRQTIIDANADNVGGVIHFNYQDTFLLFSPLPVITCDSLGFDFSYNLIDGQGLVTQPAINIVAPNSCIFPNANVAFINIVTGYFTVYNTNDSGPGSLRQAILLSNFSSSYDYISFNISGTPPHKIQLSSDLPQIINPLEIDGWTQPPQGFGFSPRIELDGSTISGTPDKGLSFVYPSYQYNAAVNGLFIHNFNIGIETYHVGQFTCGDFGRRNVISGNYSYGGRFQNDSSLQIQYNYFGTDSTGSYALPNPIGLQIYHSNTTGNSNIILNNIISGNGTGMDIRWSNNISIKGNIFGTDKNGNYAIPNTIQALYSIGQNVLIGGTGTSDGNLFSGNVWSNNGNEPGIVECVNYPPVIQGNKFGTNLAGTDTIPNLNASPIYLLFADSSLIGGSSINARNIITSLDYSGIVLDLSSNATIQNNYIGTDISGTVSYNNTKSGIVIPYCYSDSTLIQDNLIAGNAIGIRIGVLCGDNHQKILNNTIRNNSQYGILNTGDYNLFSHNSIFDNGYMGISNCCPSNNGLSPPLITFVSPDSVGGTSLPGAIIELYYSQSQNNTPQGKTYISTVTTDTSGNWKHIGIIIDVLNVTATQTDSSDNTSEFAGLWPQVTPDVWPGDCNYDLIVNNLDFLYLNIATGDTGAIRSNASINWTAQPATNWNNFFVSGANHKHADTNGDGVADLQDTTAILQNYSLTHPFRLENSNSPSVIPDFFIVSNVDTVAPGSTVTFEIHAGNSAFPIDSLYGIAYSILFNSGLVDTSQIFINYSPSVLGTIHTNMESFEKDFYSAGQIDAALCRTDHINDTTTFGLLGTIQMKVLNNISSISVLHVLPSQVRGITFSEIPVQFNLTGDSVVIDPSFVGINEVTNELDFEIYPTLVTQSYFKIMYLLPQNKSGVFEMFDVNGRKVYSLSLPQWSTLQRISLPELSDGLYQCVITSGNNRVSRKMAVVND